MSTPHPTNPAVNCASPAHSVPAPSTINSQLLTDAELDAMFDRLGTPEAGRIRIRRIRASLPDRVTKANNYSGKIRYPSRKMGFVIDTEAFATELVADVEYDHDDETREIYPQPDKLKISYLGADGKRRTTIHTTVDTFRITRDCFIFEEDKTEEFLEKESKKQPQRYVRNADGTWRSPPGDAAAAELGCRFLVRSTKQNNYTLFENLELLHDYYAKDLGPIPADAMELLQERMNGRAFITAFDLIHIAPSISADHLYTLLVRDEIYFPLHALRLTDQDTALFFRNKDAWDAYSVFAQARRPDRRGPSLSTEINAGDIFSWSGVNYQVINPGKEKIFARALDEHGGLIQLTSEDLARLVPGEITFQDKPANVGPTIAEEKMRHASQNDLQEAVWRYQILFRKPEAKNPLVKRGTRIRATWRKQYREAEEAYGNGFVGLLPSRHGNRIPKVAQENKDLALRVIEEDWETIRRKARRASWGKYRLLAIAKGFDPVSYVTFCEYVKGRRGHDQDVSRIGKAAAYDTEPPYLELERTTPKHGTHIFHYAHIDHTPLPLKFVHSVLNAIIDTVWLTILVDAFTRKVLAYYLSFDEPSYRSCMMVARDCVRRHGRASQWFISDGGGEFNSVFWEQLVASFGAFKRERRRKKPRDGSVCERIFGTTQSQFVTNLLGSTDIAEKYFRAVSPEVDPTRHAIWILDKFDVGFEKYLNEVYHVNEHEGLDMSPNAAEALSLRSHGSRPFLRIAYDAKFIAETCPMVPRGTVKVQAQGVKIKYRWFRGEILNRPGILGSKVPARYDPCDSGLAYVYVDGKWHAVYSEYYALFSGKSERTIRFAVDAMSMIARKRGQKAAVNAERLAHFLMDVEGQEAIAKQALNDAEAANHRAKINQPQTFRPNAEGVPSSNVIPIQKGRVARKSPSANPEPLEDL